MLWMLAVSLQDCASLQELLQLGSKFSIETACNFEGKICNPAQLEDNRLLHLPK